MNTSQRNLVNVRGAATEDLDVLLRNFFKAEMPDPWPELKAPVIRSVKPERSAPSRWTPVRSRLALAASVGFLMVGSWCLSGHMPNYGTQNVEPPVGPIGNAAGHTIPPKTGNPADKNVQPKAPDASALPK